MRAGVRSSFRRCSTTPGRSRVSPGPVRFGSLADRWAWRAPPCGRVLTRRRRAVPTLIHPDAGDVAARDSCETADVSAEAGDEILRLAESDPRRTIVLANTITQRANARRDFVTE